MKFASNKIEPTAQKLRGGYYNPVTLAGYLCEWAVREDGEKVLEPSAGDGNFIEALSDAVSRKGLKEPVSVTAVELDQGEVAKARSRSRKLGGAKVSWCNADFFDAYGQLPRDFDIAVGNPPFIRFQHFDVASRERAFDHLRQHGYRPTKLANAWAAFVQLSVELLRPGGRLAMVIPAELLQVKYAEELRERVTQTFDHLVIVTFKRLVFEGIQQEVVLLLAEGKRAAPGRHSLVHTLEFDDADALFAAGSLSDAIAHAPDKHARRDVKWTALFLPDRTFASLERAYRTAGIVPLGDLADVDVGIVTGRNSFFVVDRDQAERIGVNGFAQPLVGRTSSLRSICFDARDFEAHRDKHPSLLIDLNGVPEKKISRSIKTYIAQGEAAGVHEGYKCRIRRRWYDVPSIYAPDAFLFRQIHDAPLLVANETDATSTDTIHRVRFKRELSARTVAAAFCNSLTFAWAEVCGRSYGGGVLELEPREAEELPIPLEAARALDADRLDSILRERGLGAALAYSDPILLGDGLGLSADEMKAVRASWVQLRDRRKNRRHVRKVETRG
ncbi:MAG: N-6 DNA methylase [Boseongicola sp.]|nr:N-6 DNA methylase [Boseongicola sp.]